MLLTAREARHASHDARAVLGAFGAVRGMLVRPMCDTIPLIGLAQHVKVDHIHPTHRGCTPSRLEGDHVELERRLLEQWVLGCYIKQKLGRQL